MFCISSKNCKNRTKCSGPPNFFMNSKDFWAFGVGGSKSPEKKFLKRTLHESELSIDSQTRRHSKGDNKSSELHSVVWIFMCRYRILFKIDVWCKIIDDSKSNNSQVSYVASLDYLINEWNKQGERSYFFN